MVPPLNKGLGAANSAYHRFDRVVLQTRVVFQPVQFLDTTQMLIHPISMMNVMNLLRIFLLLKYLQRFVPFVLTMVSWWLPSLLILSQFTIKFTSKFPFKFKLQVKSRSKFQSKFLLQVQVPHPDSLLSVSFPPLFTPWDSPSNQPSCLNF